MTAGTLEAPAEVVRYEPWGAAAELFRYRGGEVVLDGPAGTGKSLACLYKMHLSAMRNPGMRGLIVRKWAVTLGSTTLVTYRQKVAVHALATGVCAWYGGSQQEAAAYRYENGSALVVGGMDKPSKIMSSEYDLIFADECTELDLDDWEAFSTRLRNGVISYQQQMGACNPAGPNHWLRGRAAEHKMEMFHSRHRDNPAYFHKNGTPTERGADYLAKLANLSGVRKLRLLDGIWAAAEGLVYEDFDEAVHKVPGLPKGSEQWTRYLSIDFGYNNPFVCQWWAEDPDGNLWLYREIYRTKCLVEDHARDILAQMRKPRADLKRDADPAVGADWVWTEPRPRAIICDHDAEGRATLEKYLQMSTTPAKKAVKAGVEAVEARLKVDERGKSRMYFVVDAVTERDPELEKVKKPCCTLDEMGGYVWPSGVKPDQRDNPVKEDDHGMDAMRYMAAERELGGRPGVRVLR